MLIGASWPWNLSTVPTRARPAGSSALDRADLGVVRRDDQDVVPADRPRDAHPGRPRSSRPRRSTGPSPRRARPRSATRVGAGRGDLDRAAARRRRAGDVGRIEALDREVRLGLEPVVVEDLGRERAQGRDAAARSSRGTGRGRAASSPAPPRTWASADGRRRAGATPCIGWSSCCGSPSRTRLLGRARPSRRRSRARSGRPRRRTGRRPRPPSSRDDPQPRVPAARLARPSSSRVATSRASFAWATRGSSSTWSFGRRAGSPGRRPARSAAARTSPSRLPMTLWLVAVMPTRLPGPRAGRRSSARRCTSCRTPGGPWIGERRRVERRGEPSGGRRGRSRRAGAGARRRLADPRRAPDSRSRAARCGPSASMPCSATHSPSSSSDAWWSAVRIQSSGDDRARVRVVDRRAGCRSVSAAGSIATIFADVPGRTGLPSGSACFWPGRTGRRVRGRSPGPGTRSARSACRLARLVERSDRLEPAERRRSPRRAARASSSMSRWNSHHIALSSRRCQPSSWASSQRACCSGRRARPGPSGRRRVGQPVHERLRPAPGPRSGPPAARRRGARTRHRPARSAPRARRAAPPASRAAAGC